MQGLHRRLSLIVIVGAISCNGPTSPPSPCNGTIEVSAITTTPVRFSWNPACGISELVVSTESALPEVASVWGFSVSEQNPVGPDVVFGVKPRGATEWTSPDPLEVGRVYRVTVRYTVGRDAVVAQGQRAFVWFPPD
jgi:hypothetical protein